MNFGFSEIRIQEIYHELNLLEDNINKPSIQMDLSEEKLQRIYQILMEARESHQSFVKEIRVKKEIEIASKENRPTEEFQFEGLQKNVDGFSIKINLLIKRCRRDLDFCLNKKASIGRDAIARGAGGAAGCQAKGAAAPSAPQDLPLEKERGLYFALSENPPQLNSGEEGDGEIVLHQRSALHSTEAFFALRVHHYLPNENSHTLDAISKIFRGVNPLRPQESFEENNFCHITLGVISAPKTPEGSSYEPYAHITSYKFKYIMEQDQKGALISKITNIAGKVLNNPIIVPNKSHVYYEEDEKNELYRRDLRSFPVNTSVDCSVASITEPLKTLGKKHPEEFPLADLEPMNALPFHISLFTSENMNALRLPIPPKEASPQILSEYNHYIQLLLLYLYDSQLAYLPNPETVRAKIAEHYGIDTATPLSYETVTACKERYLSIVDKTVFDKKMQSEKIVKAQKSLRTACLEEEKAHIEVKNKELSLIQAKRALREITNETTLAEVNKMQELYNLSVEDKKSKLKNRLLLASSLASLKKQKSP